MNKNVSGFTIVELLIVIVVIAILAAISVVAYSGIQNRTNDSIIQSDLVAFSKKARIHHVDNGIYPDTIAKLEAMKFKATSTSAYMTNPNVTRNLIYCFTTIYDNFTVLSKSKSGNAFMISSSNSSPQPFTATWDAGTAAGVLCDGLDGTGGAYANASSAGYWTGQNPNWIPWTGLN